MPIRPDEIVLNFADLSFEPVCVDEFVKIEPEPQARFMRAPYVIELCPMHVISLEDVPE